MSTITTLLRFQVDNREAKRALDDLKKKQQGVADDAEKHAQLQDKHFKAQLDQWAKIGAGILAVVGIYKSLSAAAEKYAKIAQLEGAAVGADIKAIQNAAGGLLTSYQSLQFAAAALNTDFKLSQREMEQVSRFMIVLRNQGNDLETVYNDVTKAIVEGNAEGLKKFGIVIKAQAGSLDAHRKIMARIAEENAKAGDNIFRAGDEVKRADVKWQDAMDELTKSLGRVAVALTPVVELIADVAKYVAQIMNYFGGGNEPTSSLGTLEKLIADRRKFAKDLPKVRWEVEQGLTNRGQLERLEAALAKYDEQIAQEIATLSMGRGRKELLGLDARMLGLPGALGVFGVAGRGVAGFVPAPRARPARRRGGGGGGEPYTFGGTDLQDVEQYAHQFGALGQLPGGVVGGGFPGLELGAGRGLRAQGSIDFSLERGLQDQIGDVFGRQSGKTFEQIIEGSTMAATALTTLQSVGVEAFNALATGAGNAGSALRGMLLDGVMAMGQELAAKTVYHGIAALASLALGRPDQAAIHGKVAGESAAGSALLAGLARAMGAGNQRQQSGGGGYRGALPGAAAGAFGGGGGVNTERYYVIPVGLDDDPRATRKRIADTMERTNREQGKSSTVEYR